MEKFTAQGRWDAEARRWRVTVDSSPHCGSAIAEGYTRTEAKDGMIDLLALLLGHRDFDVHITFEEELRG